MAVNESKAIKRLKKQVKKLEKRIDDMRKEINGLRDATGTTGTEYMAADVQKESAHGVGRISRFSEEEAEMADEITEEAEEVADLLEKTDR